MKEIGFDIPDSQEKLLVSNSSVWTTSQKSFDALDSKKSIASRKSRHSHISQPNLVKDSRSFVLSVFNMMNLIVGGGVIGLPFAASNFGEWGFVCAISTVIIIAMTSQYFNLCAAEKLEQIDPDIIPGYEELGFLAAGNRRWGKLAVSSIVMFHTFTCCCAYTFVIKEEVGPIIARILNLVRHENNDTLIDLEMFRSHDRLPEEFWYLDSKFTLGLFMVIIILPLSYLRSVRHLGWTSMIAMIAVGFFVITVISRQEDGASQCPIKLNPAQACNFDGEQVCEVHAFHWTKETIYALPTLLFSFECHGTMLPIYCDLRRKSKPKMLKIIAITLSLVGTIYILTAIFGYRTFYNYTASEFLTAFEYLHFENFGINMQIILAKFMMVLVVTFSAPLFCFVFRKSVFLNAFPDRDPADVSNLLHYGFTTITMLIVYVIVVSVTDLKIFFALGGQISATNLMIIFPGCFYVFVVHRTRKFQLKTLVAWIFIIFGFINMTLGSINIIYEAITAVPDDSAACGGGGHHDSVAHESPLSHDLKSTPAEKWIVTNVADCWHECGASGGFCDTSFCGVGGYCCSTNPNNENLNGDCSLDMLNAITRHASDVFYHTCVGPKSSGH